MFEMIQYDVLMTEWDVVIRDADEGDRRGVLGLAPRLAEGLAPWRDQEAAKAAGHRWLEGSLAAAASGDGIVLVARRDAEAGDGAVLGVISVRPVTHFTGERDGYIGELVVAERAGRRGIGRALVGTALDWVSQQGLANLTLHTGAYNAGARAFYASLGFREEEVRLTMPVPPHMPKYRADKPGGAHRLAGTVGKT